VRDGKGPGDRGNRKEPGFDGTHGPTRKLPKGSGGTETGPRNEPANGTEERADGDIWPVTVGGNPLKVDKPVVERARASVRGREASSKVTSVAGG